MKHLTWIGLALLLLGAGCSTSSNQTANVDLSETQEIPPATAANPSTDIDGDGGGDVAAEEPVDVQLDLGDNEESGATIISMTANGFEPSSITVKAGTTVTFINNDLGQRWPASAFHPTHTQLPGFDSLGAVAPGGSYSFTFEKKGKWNFHDHLFPAMFGSVTVE